jgi:hypothetical protein
MSIADSGRMIQITLDVGAATVIRGLARGPSTASSPARRQAPAVAASQRRGAESDLSRLSALLSVRLRWFSPEVHSAEHHGRGRCGPRRPGLTNTASAVLLRARHCNWYITSQPMPAGTPEHVWPGLPGHVAANIRASVSFATLRRIASSRRYTSATFLFFVCLAVLVFVERTSDGLRNGWRNPFTKQVEVEGVPRVPPLYESFHEHELRLPQHDASLRFPEGKDGRYIWFANHAAGEYEDAVQGMRLYTCSERTRQRPPGDFVERCTCT